MNRTRAAAALAALSVAPAALADAGGITASGWISMLAIAVVVGGLFVVHKKLT